MIDHVYIPYGAYWTTPFARWQGSLAHLHSLRFAAHVARQALSARDIDTGVLDHGVLGTTVPQQNCFYGLPWIAGMLEAPQIAGPTINQACATSVRVIAHASDQIRAGRAKAVLTLTADRVSNGPHIYYPDPQGPGGTGAHENWVLDNFARDPLARCEMVDTAENCARKWKIDTEEQHAVVVQRYEQYCDATRGEPGERFQDRYMTLPLDIPDSRFRKTVGTLDGDEGIRPSTAEGLAALRPVKEGGTVTYGGQTHPADGSAGMILCDQDMAAALARDPAVTVRVLGVGESRADLAYMPAAPVEAARRALADAELELDQITAVKTHNPFAVNDILFARETGFSVERMNNYGCSLIWGHPQGPTGMRAIIELIEELAQRGGGLGLFHGCAAGDTAMALVVQVGTRAA